MSSKVSFLAIGSELLDGRVVNTNATFFAERLLREGIQLHQILTCDDVLEDIIAALEYLLKTVNVIIISGGLGPTADDLTREAVASFMGGELEERPELVAWLVANYQQRKRVFDKSNLKQALLPQGATIIENKWGTAPGFHGQVRKEGQEVHLIALPGVPRELQPMCEASVIPLLQKLCLTSPLYERRLTLFGLPEAAIGSRIQSLNLPSDIKVSYRVIFPEVQLTLRASRPLEVEEALCKQALGEEFVVSSSSQGLIMTVSELLREKGVKVCTVESCTGGLIGELLTQTPGASEYYLGGTIPYHETLKTLYCGVSTETIKQYGSVSPEVTEVLAVEGYHRARKVYKKGLLLSLAITGYAGPDGGDDEHPIGTFYLSLAAGANDTVESIVMNFYFPQSRELFRKYAAFRGIEIVRRKLLGLPLCTDAFTTHPSQGTKNSSLHSHLKE